MRNFRPAVDDHSPATDTSVYSDALGSLACGDEADARLKVGRLLRRVPLPRGAVVSVFVVVIVVNDKIDNSMRALIRLEARILTCHRHDHRELRQPSGFRFRWQR